MLSNTREIRIEDLRKEVAEYKFKGYRYVTSSCSDLGEGKFDIIYHFDKDYNLENLRITVEENQVVPSISDIYFAAVLVENEIKDLYGINFEGLLVDYEGKFLITEDVEEAPMRKKPVVKLKKGDNQVG
ncbi:NADH-quinone oxidoreductase subunit C [Caldicellulosiruptoraceae bacterium PP1]